jgi:hypothetical protein
MAGLAECRLGLAFNVAILAGQVCHVHQVLFAPEIVKFWYHGFFSNRVSTLALLLRFLAF